MGSVKLGRVLLVLASSGRLTDTGDSFPLTLPVLVQFFIAMICSINGCQGGLAFLLVFAGGGKCKISEWFETHQWYVSLWCISLNDSSTEI